MKRQSIARAIARCAALIAVGALGMMLAGPPAEACLRRVSPEGVDQALAKAKLSAGDSARVRQLRSRLDGHLARGDWRGAMSTEEQAMAIMGLAFEEGPPSRGCSGRWVRRTG